MPNSFDTARPVADSEAARPLDDVVGDDERFAGAWRTFRPRLVAQAKRTLRDESAAEDVVQEAFRRLSRIPLDELRDVGGWLSVVVRRLCLNRLRTAYLHHEQPGLDAALLLESTTTDPGDPAERATLDDQVQRALAVVLQRLTPAERTSFILHDVFGFPFDAIGSIVGRSAAACRQLASRARRTVRQSAGNSDHVTLEPAQHRELVERFIAACAGGDLAELTAVLDPAVHGHAELIGFGTIVELTGRPAVAQRLVGMFGPGTHTLLVPVSIEGDPGVVAYVQGRVAAVVRLEQQRDTIVKLRAFVLPPHERGT